MPRLRDRQSAEDLFKAVGTPKPAETVKQEMAKWDEEERASPV